MDNFGISDTRSRHEDTDFVFLSATVGANPPVFVEEVDGRCEQRHPFRWTEHRSRHSRRRYDRGVQLPDHEQRPWRRQHPDESRAGRVVHHRQRDRQAQGHHGGRHRRRIHPGAALRLRPRGDRRSPGGGRSGPPVVCGLRRVGRRGRTSLHLQRPHQADELGSEDFREHQPSRHRFTGRLRLQFAAIPRHARSRRRLRSRRSWI